MLLKGGGRQPMKKGVDAYDKTNVIKGFLDDYEIPDPIKTDE